MRRLLMVALATVLLATLPSVAARAAVPELQTVEVSFRGADGLPMHGSVLSPATRGAPRPGLVLVGGSSPGTPRTKLMNEAVAFAKQGMSVLIYDKRAYSMAELDYGRLADDALGAVGALRAQPGVDKTKVGLWGFSEGGWVAPLAASRSADVSFLILVGANAISPLRQQTWAVAAGLRKAGVAGSIVDRAEPSLYRLLADAGQFPEPYHDASAVLAKVRQPILAIWGDHDLLTPPQENPPLLVRALGHDHYTLRFFPGDHAVHDSPDGGVTRLPTLTPGYADAIGAWVTRVTRGELPSGENATPAPRQANLSVAVPPMAWWESATVQLAALALLMVAFAAYPLWALARRLRGRRVSGGRPARLLSAAGLVVTLGTLAYLMYLTLTGAKLAHPGPVLAGRPLVWLGLQVLAVAAVVSAALAVPAWRRASGSERVRLSLLLTGGTLLVPWALYWGLLLP
ncbi:alpha/beta hydrolase family protein [Nonomuraea sp. NPDC050536]|uniref:alpha/beta hydrolase family protein n=1 Tax=Nonomuraea sp. NPDC050536 TaxID=3364366 RepID=UPI0037C5D023